MIIRGHCAYLRETRRGELVRAKRYYYEENPDRWPAETQTDTLWLKEQEWKTFIPAKPKDGQVIQISQSLQNRFFGTLGLEFMEGSVHSALPRRSKMTLTIMAETPRFIKFRIDGEAEMGKAFDRNKRRADKSRGCSVRILGFARYEVKEKKFSSFDVVGLGKAWGNRGRFGEREVRIREYPWDYGIAWELVTTNEPRDRIPPYNLLHYAGFPYWGKK